MILWHALDIGLLVFHCAFIAFNCFGMFWRKTRRWNLFTLAFTAFSWGALGYWYGWGYCFLTDWHWQIKEKLGVTGLPNSYLKWMVDAPTGWDVSAQAVDAVAAGVFALSIVVSVALNVRDWRRERTTGGPD